MEGIETIPPAGGQSVNRSATRWSKYRNGNNISRCCGSSIWHPDAGRRLFHSTTIIIAFNNVKRLARDRQRVVFVVRSDLPEIAGDGYAHAFLSRTWTAAGTENKIRNGDRVTEGPRESEVGGRARAEGEREEKRENDKRGFVFLFFTDT